MTGTTRADVRAQASHHASRARPGAAPAHQAHRLGRSGRHGCGRGAGDRGCPHARGHVIDGIHGSDLNHHRDGHHTVAGIERLVVEQLVVIPVDRVGKRRELLLSKYRDRRIMTVIAHRGAAFGTSMHVVVTDPAHLDGATASVARVVDSIDRACSRFRDDSELSRLLAPSGPKEAVVSPLLAQALATALRAAEITDGAVDPTVGEAVRGAGYTVDFGSLAPDGAPIDLLVRPVPGWRLIRLYAASRRVEIPDGVEIDLGATAKALAADLGAAAARDTIGGGGVLVSLGGDVAVAGRTPEDGWHVQIAEDSRAPITRGAETIAIRSGGVATSSTTVRRWRRGGVELHHIIDPATGLPADGPWRTVSVVAGSCVDANIAATAAIVRGIAATAWLESAGLPARLVDRTGAVIRVAGWPAPVAQTS
jgi:thiamine biosynthesis lipoprotein ApbE